MNYPPQIQMLIEYTCLNMESFALLFYTRSIGLSGRRLSAIKPIDYRRYLMVVCNTDHPIRVGDSEDKELWLDLALKAWPCY